MAKDKSYEEFIRSYPIWDFGDNHLAEKKGHYPHNNFVRCNMSEEGYHKMVECLIQYIKNSKKNSTVTDQFNI